MPFKEKMARRSNFRKTVFSNGLTLVSESHHEFRSLSLGVWVKAGTRHEKPSESGASHFIEHMLFKGTESRTALQIAREVDRVGGDFNAFTAREYTCFNLLLLGRDLGLGVDILNDIVLNSKFDADELERERRVILQEIAMVEDSPEELAHDVLFETIYPRHGLGRPILGTEASIRRMRRGDLLRYFRKHYRPDRLIIAVAGDVSHESVLRRLRPLCAEDWPGRPVKNDVSTDFISAGKIRSGSWWLERLTEQVHLLWAVEGPKYSSRDRFAAFLLNVYLGGGMSSSLFQEIREKNGLAYTVYSSFSPFLDSGVFSVYVATLMGQVPLCLKLIEECVERLKKELITEEELKSVKDNLKGSILLSSDSVESRMSSIAKNEMFFGKYFSIEDICRFIDDVKPSDVKRIARRLLSSERSILALGPSPKKGVSSRLRPHLIKR